MRAGLLVLPLLLLLAVFAVRAEQDSSEEPKFREPVKVVVPADRLADLLREVQQGTLVKMPLSEYEDRLRRLREGRSSGPRLVETVFKARLHEDAGRRGQAYLSGSASWTILNPVSPSVLKLTPLTLALQKTRFENRDALVGDFVGEQPGLLLDQTGKQTVLFDFTARGDHTPEGINFDWQVPAAPLAQLELNLPLGRSPSVAAGCLVSPPELAETPDRRLWKIRFANRSSLELKISPAPHETPAASPGGPLVIDSVRSRHELTPEGETSEFTFDLRISARGMRSLSFACDAPLHPYQAELRTADTARLERMEWQPGAAGNGRSLLTLHFREPLSGTVHPRLLCRSPLPLAPATWTCPAVTLHPGSLMPRMETIELGWSPQLRLDRWQAGDYRISAPDTKKVDGMRVLTLIGSGLPGGAPNRPQARLQTHGIDAHARALTWLRAGPASSTLDVQIAYEVRQGRLFEEQVWIAPGWEVEQVSCSAPTERLRTWAVKNPPADIPPRIKGGKIVVAEMQTPLEAPARAGEPAPVLSLRLRGPGFRGSPLSLPGVVPAGAATLEGILGIDWDEDGYEGTITVTPASAAEKAGRQLPAASAALLADEGPWGKRTPLRHISWKGQPPSGTLLLRQRLIESRAHSRNDIFLGAGRADVTARLTLEVLRGAAETIDLRLSTPLPIGTGTPQLKVIGRKEDDPLSVLSFERTRETTQATAISLLAGRQPLGLAGLLVPGTGDERWRVRLSRPLPPKQPLVLEWRATLRASEEKEPFRVPLLTFADPSGADGEIRLFVEESEPPVGILFAGMTRARERIPAGSGEPGPPFRVYRHDSSPVSLALRLAASGDKPIRPLGIGLAPSLPRAELLTRVDPDGRLVQLYTFSISNWSQSTLPLRLPIGAQLVALRIDGRDATPQASVTDSADESRQGPIIEIPVPGSRSPSGAAVHQFAVLYVSAGDLGRLWGRLQAAAPEAPLEPLAFRRVWRLPAGLTPVGHSSLVRLPGPPVSSGLASWSLSERLPILSGLVPHALALDRWAVPQEQAVRATDSRFRRAAGGQTRTLGEALRQLTAGLAEQGVPLVIDGWALAEKGFLPGQTFTVGAIAEDDETSAPALASLSPLELVYIPGKPAVLVTTRKQAQAWERADTASEEGGAPRNVIQALAVAAVHGRDRTGRFQSVPAWLESPPRPMEQIAPGPALEPLASEDELAVWTDWESTAGAEDMLWVVRARAPAGVGLGLALLFFAWAIRIRSQRRCRSEEGSKPGIGQGTLALLLGWVGLTGLGVLWLPAGLRDLAAWPLAMAIVVGLWWYLAPPPKPSQATTIRRAKSSIKVGPVAATVGVLVLFWTAWSSGPAAQPPADRPTGEALVYILPAHEGDKEPASVLLSPALLKRLEPRPALRTLAEAVLIDADYQATVRAGGGSVHVDATLQVYCPGADPATLILPLDGIKLDREPLLDGAPAALTSLPGMRTGEVLAISGAGMHKVQLSFIAPVKKGDDQSDLLLGVPRTTQGRFSLRVPGKGLFIESLAHLGAQKLTEDAMGVLLEVEIGPVAAVRKADAARPAIPLHFRWSNGQPGNAVPVKYREAYLWDLGQRGYSLTGVVQFDVGPGAVERLSFDLPPELSVHNLEVRRTPASPALPLRDWRLATVKGAAVPQLQVDFPAPLTGSLQVTLLCYPRSSLFEAARSTPGQAFIPTLPVPRPQGNPVRNGSFLAYRLQGVEAERGQVFRLSGLADVREFPTIPGSAPNPTYACRIDRGELQPPILPLRLRTLPAPRTGSMQVTWRVDSACANLQANLELKAADADLALIECNVPAPVEITAVLGADVRDWSTYPFGGGQRLQIWLQRPSASARVELRGYVPLTRLPVVDRTWNVLGVALGMTVRSNLSRASVFSLPALRIAGLERSPPSTTIELIAADGLMLSTQNVRNLSPEELGQPRERLTYTAKHEDYAGQFVVAPGVPPSVRLVTRIELTDRQLVFRTRIEPLQGRTSLRSLELRLRGWPGSSVRLDAADAKVVSEEQGQGVRSRRAWSIRNERSGLASVVLSGSASLEEIAARASEGGPAGLLVPDVQAAGAVCVERWVILDRSVARFRLEGAQARPIESPALSEATAALRAGGKLWRMDGSGGSAILVETERAQAAVQVVAREHAAAMLDQRRWNYQSSWWLFHDGPAELVLTLPGGGKPTTVAIDGIDQPLSRDDSREVRIPLRGMGARRLVVRWLGSPGKGTLSAPEAETPRLNVDAGGPGVRLLTVPIGARLSSPAGMHSGLLAAAQVELERAAGQQQLSRLLLESLPAQRVPEPEEPSRESRITACQQRLARHLWNADQLLKLAGTEKGTAEAVERLQDLREQQRELLRRHGREMPRLESGDSLKTDRCLADQARSGRVYSRVEDGSPKTAAPLLVTEESLEFRHSLGGTGLLSCFLVVIWVLASFSPVVKLARIFWPEQAVLLGLVGLRVFGPSWVVVFLLALGIVARLLLLGSAVVSLVHRWLPQAQRA
jgi:hypothetical protein